MTIKTLSLIFILICNLIIGISTWSQKYELWAGGSMGYAIPSNLGNKEYNIGFADVANSGPRIAGEISWFYNPRLSLNGELAYTHFKSDDAFWNVARYGDIEVDYQLAEFSAHGLYYFKNKGSRGYIGMGFGGYVILNNLVFNSSYVGTNNDASVSYNSSIIKPGLSPHIGYITPLSKKSYFFIDLKLQLIPNLTAEVVPIYDEFGNIINTITKNPHGHENHWVLSMGFLWGVK